MDKLEELFENPVLALGATLTGYVCAVGGIASGFYLLYKIVSHN